MRFRSPSDDGEIIPSSPRSLPVWHSESLRGGVPSSESTKVSTSTQLLVSTDDGLHCPEGGFHIDPWRPVDRAVITHAHSDHLVAGCTSYLCAAPGVGVLRERLGHGAKIETLEYDAKVRMRGVHLSLHPAGHILGSAQVRVEQCTPGSDGARRGTTWVFSGDYKTEADRTCAGFEPVSCDVFITESTFGLPIYKWRSEHDEFARVNAWWSDNADQGRTSVLFAYALGKAQRLLAGVDPEIGPIAVHGAVDRFNRAYRASGVALTEAPHAAGDIVQRVRGRGLVIAPPSALGSPWIRKFAAVDEGFSGAFASGWMQVRGTRRRKAIDRGFVISDHADWPGLLSAIEATGASRVGVTHGYVRPLVRWLIESGYEAFAVPTRYTGERGEDAEAPESANHAEMESASEPLDEITFTGETAH